MKSSDRSIGRIMGGRWSASPPLVAFIDSIGGPRVAEPPVHVRTRRVPRHTTKGHSMTGPARRSNPTQPNSAPRQSVDQTEPPPDIAADEVDEAAWESFPASDPPAWRDH